MLENQKIRPAQVIGPLGEPLTLDSLPPAETTRWVVRRKAEVVAAVSGGLLTVDEACKRYTDDFPLTKAGMIEWFFLPVQVPLPIEALFREDVDLNEPLDRTRARAGTGAVTRPS